jgi:uncharacterized membrane-anchored protein
MDKFWGRIFKYALYAIVAMQVIMPVYIIIKSEITLSQGKEFKFLVRPIDPYDPFRGRYVSLGMMQTSAEAPYGVHEKGDAYAVLIVDGGFAKTEYLSADKPWEGADYVKVRIDSIYPYSGKNTAYFRYPFDKIFYNEKTAPEIDRAFWSYKGRIYVTVFIRDGEANIGKLYFDGIEAEQYIKNPPALPGR